MKSWCIKIFSFYLWILGSCPSIVVPIVFKSHLAYIFALYSFPIENTELVRLLVQLVANIDVKLNTGMSQKSRENDWTTFDAEWRGTMLLHLSRCRYGKWGYEWASLPPYISRELYCRLEINSTWHDFSFVQKTLGFKSRLHISPLPIEQKSYSASVMLHHLIQIKLYIHQKKIAWWIDDDVVCYATATYIAWQIMLFFTWPGSP